MGRPRIESSWPEKKVGYSSAAKGQIKDTQATGHYVLSLLEAGAVAWQYLTDLTEQCATAGRAIEGSERVPTVRAEMDKLLADFDRRWPFVRSEDVERGSREIASGEFVAGEDLLRELHRQVG